MMGQTILHADTGGSFITAWSVDPLVAVPLLWCALAYGWGVRSVRNKGAVRWPWSRAFAFYGGLFFLMLALLGPPGVWNDDLFFIHMLQHLLLMMAAAPLILLGRPVQLLLRAIPPPVLGRVTRPILRRGGLRTTLTILTYPAVVLVLFNLNLVLWHLPGAYDQALQDGFVHELEHGAFLTTALLFWWVLIDPVPRHHKTSAHWLFAMSFASCMVGSLLGAALTLSPETIYAHYETTASPWGISPLTDQHIGGGLMWAAGGIYFAIMFVALYRMVQLPANEPVTDTEPGHAMDGKNLTSIGRQP
jgi:putative membrane protein